MFPWLTLLFLDRSRLPGPDDCLILNMRYRLIDLFALALLLLLPYVRRVYSPITLSRGQTWTSTVRVVA